MKPGRATWLILLVSGTAALGMGVAGAFLPGLPTAPFLLIAAGCYARSSDRMYRWLLGHGRFGPPIKRLLAGQGLSLRAKLWSLGLAYAVLGLTAAFGLERPWARILLLALAGVKTYYMLFRLPTATGATPPPGRK
ncbi:TPA: DUF454 domain-containing protein [Candidatus Acetothermia bacterium]|nr:DUF454 domain-containing protein [Candidatus Acetothermia bacterium]